MRRESISGLSELTSLDRRTVKGRLAGLSPEIEGKAHLYRTDEALPLLYCTAQEELDYQQERARLTHHQANKTELEEEELRGILVRVDQVVDIWTNSISNCKTKLLGLPSKLTHLILAAEDHKQALAIFDSGIKEALNELATGNIKRSEAVDSETLDSSPEPDS